MIKYKGVILPNGLQILVNRDHASKLAAVNILYRVGARNESEHKTGFAHLFEHLKRAGDISLALFVYIELGGILGKGIKEVPLLGNVGNNTPCNNILVILFCKFYESQKH